jgi:hypothetical protein
VEPIVRRRARIGLDERFALFAHPRSAIEFELPAGDFVFRTGLAFDPVCLDWGGGGARFVVEVDGRAVLDRRLDPKRDPADRGWREVEAAFGLGRPGVLTLRTLPADGDDLTALWTWWGRPVLAISARTDSRLSASERRRGEVGPP